MSWTGPPTGGIAAADSRHQNHEGTHSYEVGTGSTCSSADSLNATSQKHSRTLRVAAREVAHTAGRVIGSVAAAAACCASTAANLLSSATAAVHAIETYGNHLCSLTMAIRVRWSPLSPL